MFNLLEIQTNVIVVSWRNRRAIFSFCASPFRRRKWGQSRIIAYYCFPPAWRNRFANEPAAPMFNLLEIQASVIVVSWRNRRAIFSFCASPFRRRANSASVHPRRWSSFSTSCSAHTSSLSRRSSPP